MEHGYLWNLKEISDRQNVSNHMKILRNMKTVKEETLWTNRENELW